MGSCAWGGAVSAAGVGGGLWDGGFSGGGFDTMGALPGICEGCCFCCGLFFFFCAVLALFAGFVGGGCGVACGCWGAE